MQISRRPRASARAAQFVQNRLEAIERPVEIRARVAPHERIEIAMEDGCRLAANAVTLGNTLIMSGCGRRLRAELGERGYEIVATPLSSFLRSGGSAFCLTLRLDRRSVPAALAQNAAVA